MKKPFTFFLACMISFTALFSQDHPEFRGENKIYFGSSYYPEDWGMQGINEDIVRMKELNMNVVRMAEFSWSKMEPSEGVFNFGWLHQVIAKLHQNGIDVILGTPTATPPAWLGKRYPQIYRTGEDGFHLTHGARRNTSYSDSIYRKYSGIIVARMASEFGHEPGLIAWQTDNEFNLAFDYSPETGKLWHGWLQKEYGNIDSLNMLWNNVIWSQTYDSFDEIPMPGEKVWHHPSLRLAWYRFTMEQVCAYQQLQLDSIRKYSDLPITHDGMPGQKLDYQELFKNLDFMAVNNYHSYEAYDLIPSNYDRMRGYGKGLYWLTETAPNFSGGGKEGNTWFLHEPEGSMHAALWLSYALGGQGALFWPWKEQWAGQEMPHGAVISSWNEPAANYKDIEKLGKELKQYGKLLMDNPVDQAEIALVYSHLNDFGLSNEHYYNEINYYRDWSYRFYIPLSQDYFHRDVIGTETDISGYKLILLPLMPFIPEDFEKKLENWVLDGGILILGPMSGYRTADWTSFKNHAYGPLGEWSGISVESRIPVNAFDRAGTVTTLVTFPAFPDLRETQAGLWSDALSSKTGKVLAPYRTGMHDGKPAIVENRKGRGRVVILGTDPGKEAFVKIVEKYATEEGIRRWAMGDPGVMLVPRKSIIILDNISNERKILKLNASFSKDLITGKIIDPEKLQLSPYQVMILVK